jgi:MerR family transcriptional regulator/heat shock protein HspR
MLSSEALFVISVAARLVELHPTTLRKYERAGFLEPSRTVGNIRLYSPEDISRLRQIKYLVDDLGVNLAGVQLALELTWQLRQLGELMERAAGESTRREALGRVDQLLHTLGAGSRSAQPKSDKNVEVTRG